MLWTGGGGGGDRNRACDREPILSQLEKRSTHNVACHCSDNLVPRVLRLFGQQVDARRDPGVLEFY